MRNWITRILGLSGMLCCVVALAGVPSTKPVDVRDLMTVTQFDKAGLNKLSPQELQALNGWLNQYLNSHSAAAHIPVAPKAAVPTSASSVASFGADTMRHKESAHQPERIETRIAGMFTGWTGNTIFKLENGQVWQQAATGFFSNVELDHPQVVIKKLSFGYLLTLPGHGETVFVRRLK